MPNALHEFSDMDLLARLPSLEIQARFLVEGFMTGMHRSPLRGFNVEFKEYRGYEPGDEPRTIDWKVYARTEKLQVKVREEDTNLTAYVMVDASASMAFRGPNAGMSKWAYARGVAAAMILLLYRQRDAVSLGVLGAGEPPFIRPTLKLSEQRHMLAMLDREADSRTIDSRGNRGVADAAGRSLARGLEQLVPLVRRRSLVFILSDFYEDPEALEAPLQQLHHSHCEPIFLQVLDPTELSFDFDAPVQLVEMETKDRMVVTPDLLREQYLERLKAHQQALMHTVRSYGGDYHLLPTDQPPYRAWGGYLARRKGAL